MSDPFRKVKTGDPLSIPATTYNAMLDAAIANMRMQNRPSAIRGDHGVHVMVRNETGYDLEQFEVLGIDGPVFHPREQPDAFQQTPVLRGVVPEKKHKGKFVVLQEAASMGAVVRACLSGLTVARVYVEEAQNNDQQLYSIDNIPVFNTSSLATQDDSLKAKRIKSPVTGPSPKACDIEEGYTYDLTGTSSGGASILWIEEGVGQKWALIRIGHGDTSTLFPVTLKQSDGESGDHESQCSFSYDVYEFPDTGGAAIAENVDPNDDNFYRRPGLGKMKVANFGIAFHDENNELKLAWCNEVMEIKSCSAE